MFAVAIVCTIVAIGYFVAIPKFDPIMLPSEVIPDLNYLDPEDFTNVDKKNIKYYWQRWIIKKHEIESEDRIDLNRAGLRAIYKEEGTTQVKICINDFVYTMDNRKWILYDSNKYKATIANTDDFVDAVMYTLDLPYLNLSKIT